MELTMSDSLLLGVTGGILGVFYRNLLKGEKQLLNWWYVILSGWVKKADMWCDIDGCHQPSVWASFRGWVAYPLGYCIYCSTTWITIFLCIIYWSGWEVLPIWQDIAIGVTLALGVQHIIVLCICRFLLQGHPDFGEKD